MNTHTHTHTHTQHAFSHVHFKCQCSVGHDRGGRTIIFYKRKEWKWRHCDYKSQFLVVVIMIAVVTLFLVPYQSAVHLRAVIILHHSLYLLANVGFGNTKTVIFNQCCISKFKQCSYSKLHLSFKGMLMRSAHF